MAEKEYVIGDQTMAKVFKPSGLTDVSDLQTVFNAVERALATSTTEALVKALEGRSTAFDALLWYGEHAIAADKAMKAEQVNAMTAILTTLALDQGKRATKAMQAMTGEQHPDDKAVDDMLKAMGDGMKEKLAKKRAEGYSGWNEITLCSHEFLVKELLQHVRKGDPIDVANFCMFLFHRGERID